MKHIFQLLSSNGDGTGTTVAIGDYSSTPLVLKYQPDTEHRARVERIIIKITDAGVFDADKYGNGITLTNGIRIYHYDSSDAVIEEITAFPILTNGDWAGHCHDFTQHSFGSGNDIASIRWTFSKSGAPMVINGHLGEYLAVVLNDDFTGLVDHKFQIQGTLGG